MGCINVTCAIVVVEGKILACQRGACTDHPFEWEFPGGKIEDDETAEQSIIREMKEELDVVIEVEKQLLAIEHDYGFKKIQLIPFLCRIIEGELKALEHESICWQPINCFDELNWSGADENIYLLNRNKIK